MRKQIQSAWFVQQLSSDLDTLSTIKKRVKAQKSQAKEAYQFAAKESSKKDDSALKINYLQAKIRYKAAKLAHKAASKVITPYLSETAIDEHNSTEKKLSRKADSNGTGSPSKEVQTKSVKEPNVKTVKADKIVKAKKESTKEKTVGATKVKGQAAKSDKPTKSKIQADDLTLIEGIGPKIAQILHQNDVHSFNDLVAADANALKDLLQSKGLRFANPATWSEQAQLAATGKIKELEILKKELKRGK